MSINAILFQNGIFSINISFTKDGHIGIGFGLYVLTGQKTKYTASSPAVAAEIKTM